MGIITRNEPLTICAVYHSPATQALLERNVMCTAAMNPGYEIRWLAADNTPGGGVVSLGDSVAVVKGAPLPAGVPSWAKGSYHHAAGITLLLPHIRTRFALILDVDYFIVRPRWAETILLYMKEKHLALFGSPYHPRDYGNYRYFPCAYCLFVDGTKIDFSGLDFSPRMETGEGSSRLKRFLRKTLPSAVVGQRYFIGASKDTGYEIYRRYAHDASVNIEVVTPVWEPRRSVFEYLLPERFCLVPKRKDSMSSQHFSLLGHTDLDGLGWEEYVWKGKPFSFHVRSGTTKMRDNTTEKIAFLDRILAEFRSAPDNGFVGK